MTTQWHCIPIHKRHYFLRYIDILFLNLTQLCGNDYNGEKTWVYGSKQAAVSPPGAGGSGHPPRLLSWQEVFLILAIFYWPPGSSCPSSTQNLHNSHIRCHSSPKQLYWLSFIILIILTSVSGLQGIWHIPRQPSYSLIWEENFRQRNTNPRTT